VTLYACRIGLVSALLFSQVASAAAPSENEEMELYVKFHMSADREYDGEQHALSLSNNSSRFGFMGHHKTSQGHKFLWRIENKVYVDESGGKLGNPVYAGFELPMGKILMGFIDTPYKTFVSKFNVMDDTIADVRSILGYNALGADAADNLNVRARNAFLYSNTWGPFYYELLYSAEKGATGTSTGTDDNSQSGYSSRVEYRNKPYNLGIASEQWRGGNKLKGARIGARYQGKPWRAGVVYERINSSVNSVYQRSAYAIDAGYKINKSLIKAQYIVALANKRNADSGATMISFGDYYKIDKELTLYLIGTTLSNAANAKYRLGTSGHGDIISPGYGGDIWTLSLGLIFRVDWFL